MMWKNDLWPKTILHENLNALIEMQNCELQTLTFNFVSLINDLLVSVRLPHHLELSLAQWFSNPWLFGVRFHIHTPYVDEKSASQFHHKGWE